MRGTEEASQEKWCVSCRFDVQALAQGEAGWHPEILTWGQIISPLYPPCLSPTSLLKVPVCAVKVPEVSLLGITGRKTMIPDCSTH